MVKKTGGRSYDGCEEEVVVVGHGCIVETGCLAGITRGLDGNVFG